MTFDRSTLMRILNLDRGVRRRKIIRMKVTLCTALTFLFFGLGWMLGESGDSQTQLTPQQKESARETTPNMEALLAPHIFHASEAKKNALTSRMLSKPGGNIVKSTDPFGKQIKEAAKFLSTFNKPDEVQSKAMNMVCEIAVNDAFVEIAKDHPSLRSAIRNGTLNIKDLLASSRKKYSIHHQAANETMVVKYFEKFSECDFAFALGFLEGVEPKAKEQALLNQCNKIMAQTGDVSRLYEVFLKQPIEPGQPLNNRFNGPWYSITKKAYERYADYYPQWLIQLPPGAERDMALSQLAYQLRAQEPEYCAELLSHKAGGKK